MNPYFCQECPYRKGLCCQEAGGCGNCAVRPAGVSDLMEMLGLRPEITASNGSG